MLPQIRSTLITRGLRHFSTSPHLQFKFKLTEELSKEFEEQQRLKKQQEIKPVTAMHTLENPIVMGRISHDRYQDVVKVAVTKHRFNEVLLMYRRESDNVLAIDENKISKPGDWVLLRRDPTIPDGEVTHRIEKVVHAFGKFVDPLTGKRAFGLYHDDDLRRLEQIRVDL